MSGGRLKAAWHCEPSTPWQIAARSSGRAPCTKMPSSSTSMSPRCHQDSAHVSAAHMSASSTKLRIATDLDSPTIPACPALQQGVDVQAAAKIFSERDAEAAHDRARRHEGWPGATVGVVVTLLAAVTACWQHPSNATLGHPGSPAPGGFDMDSSAADPQFCQLRPRCPLPVPPPPAGAGPVTVHTVERMLDARSALLALQ